MANNTHHKNVIIEMKIMTKNFVPNHHSLSKISSWNLNEEMESWWKKINLEPETPKKKILSLKGNR